MNLTEFPRHRELEAERYSKYRWGLGMTLSDLLDKAADLYPRKEALMDDRARSSMPSYGIEWIVWQSA